MSYNFEELMRHIIFIHIPKTAGRSIVTSFEQVLDSNITFHHIGHQNISRYLEIESKHSTYPIDNDTLYFTVVRNPYDRFLSAFYFHKNDSREELKAFNNPNDFALALNKNYTHDYWRQTWFIEQNDKVRFKMFYMERLNELVAYFKEEYNIILNIPHSNITEHPCFNILDNNTINIINDWFDQDFQMFKYVKIIPVDKYS